MTSKIECRESSNLALALVQPRDNGSICQEQLLAYRGGSSLRCLKEVVSRIWGPLGYRAFEDDSGIASLGFWVDGTAIGRNRSFMRKRKFL